MHTTIHPSNPIHNTPSTSGTGGLLPDAWYDILVLNSTTLTLGTDDGETVKFIKVPAESVTVMSREEYLDKHPETFPEN